VRRTIFTDEHEQFRQMVRTFLAKECVPHTAEWLEAGVVSREAWRKAGQLGLLGWMVSEEYGGYGYINEYEIARLWRDARVQRLYGGTTEIMKEIVGRGLGF